jgi:hypothetical protein
LGYGQETYSGEGGRSADNLPQSDRLVTEGNRERRRHQDAGIAERGGHRDWEAIQPQVIANRTQTEQEPDTAGPKCGGTGGKAPVTGNDSGEGDDGHAKCGQSVELQRG